MSHPFRRCRLCVVVPLALIGLLAGSGAVGAEPFVLPAGEDSDAQAVGAGPGANAIRAGRTNEPWARAFISLAPRRNSSPYPLEVNASVARFLERFQSGVWREMMNRWLDRSSRYLGMIHHVLRSKGLPEELAFTAMIESGFNPRAVSRAGAKGLWQFMEQTAQRYGLRVDRWVDERLDPEKSTEAAARHLNDLFDQFDNWLLAQAAYNAGALRVARAVKQSRSNDFWTLARGRWLRRETRQFVPQIQAGILIARAPERYGFRVTPAEPMAYEVVRIPFVVRIKGLAMLANLRHDKLRDLNPELRRGVTPPGQAYALKIPPGSTSAVAVALGHIRARRAGIPAGLRVHVVKPRDTLSGIAQRYGVTVSRLVRLNGLEEADLIRPGDRIRIAAATSPSKRESGR